MEFDIYKAENLGLYIMYWCRQLLACKKVWSKIKKTGQLCCQLNYPHCFICVVFESLFIKFVYQYLRPKNPVLT